MKAKQPWTTEEIRGDPIPIQGREFIPVVKRVSRIWRQATFGTRWSGSRGGGLVWLQPHAIVERQPDGTERRIDIPDPTRAALGGMLVAVLLMPLLFLLVASLAAMLRRRSRRTPNDSSF